MNKIVGNVERDPPRLIPCEQIGSSASAGLLLVIYVCERLPVLVVHEGKSWLCLLEFIFFRAHNSCRVRRRADAFNSAIRKAGAFFAPIAELFIL